MTAAELPRRQDLDLLVFDFDGVMTDNRVYVFSDGSEAVACNRADGLGIDMLRDSGLAMAVVSTERNPVVARRAEKLRLPVHQDIADKGEVLHRLIVETGASMARTAFVGNDVNDLPALQEVGWPLCPEDAHPDIRAFCRWVIPCAGGHGVVRHLAGVLMGAGG